MRGRCRFGGMRKDEVRIGKEVFARIKGFVWNAVPQL